MRHSTCGFNESNGTSDVYKSFKPNRGEWNLTLSDNKQNLTANLSKSIYGFFGKDLRKKANGKEPELLLIAGNGDKTNPYNPQENGIWNDPKNNTLNFPKNTANGNVC